MLHPRAVAVAMALAMFAAGPAAADPWKDESGHGRRGWEGRGPPPWAGEGPPPWARGRGERDRAWWPPVAAGVDLRCNRDLLGAAAGGVVGGVLGSGVGDGDERRVATVAGAVIGAIVGGLIGRRMDEADYACVGQALDYDATVAWGDPESGRRYRVEPLGSFENESGRLCREYVTTAVIDEQLREVRDVACRQPDGRWRREG